MLALSYQLNLSCREAFRVLSKHKKAMEFLGLPLTVGEVDLVDRKRNYIDERKSEVILS